MSVDIFYHLGFWFSFCFFFFLEGQLIYPSSPLPEAPPARDALDNLVETRSLYLNFRLIIRITDNFITDHIDN